MKISTATYSFTVAVLRLSKNLCVIKKMGLRGVAPNRD